MARSIAVALAALLFAASALAASIPVTPNRQYSKAVSGIEVIDFNAPTLAYISNLQYDQNSPNGTFPRIWFTADKSSPNAYFAQFDPLGNSPVAFWCAPKSPFLAQTAAPFIAFDVESGTLAGIAYANNYTVNQFQFSGFGPVAQAAYVNYTYPYTNNDQPALSQNQFPGYDFASVELDNILVNHDKGTGRWLYAAGWASATGSTNQGFTLARMMVGTPDPDINFDVDNEVVPASQLGLDNCYDIFTPNYKPFIFLQNVPNVTNYQVFVVPGRCSKIFKTEPAKGKPLSQGVVKGMVPDLGPTEYISSADFDATNHILWFVVKRYQQAGAYIRSVNVSSFKRTTENTSIDMGESEPIIEVGNDITNGKLTRFIYIAASGGNKIIRYTVQADGTGVKAHSTAFLATRFNEISSLLYIRPYLYFGTYEPNAQLGRVPKYSFCAQNCTDLSYCNVGVCTCVDGYYFDPNTPDINGNPSCVPMAIQQITIKAKQETGAAAALGVLWAFSLIAAIAGWYLWWKARAASYSAL